MSVTRAEMIKRLLDDDVRNIVRLVKTGDFDELHNILSFLLDYESLNALVLEEQYSERGFDDGS